MLKTFFPLFVLIATLFSCSIQKNPPFEPQVELSLTPYDLRKLPSPFPSLSEEELLQEWSKEYRVAVAFARQLDLYRALTAFQRALILMPSEEKARRTEIEYDIVLCYYLGEKFQEAITAFEQSQLARVDSSFPALKDLMAILYDSYSRIDEREKAEKLLQVIQKNDIQHAQDLRVFQALREGDLSASQRFCASDPERYLTVTEVLERYLAEEKSVRKAQVYNALLPGAGYLYVGQKQSALTSFLLNTLFTAGAWHFFERGHTAAGLILTSFEMGWYIGGINGAGLAARDYNEILYAPYTEKVLRAEKLHPLLTLQYAF